MKGSVLPRVRGSGNATEKAVSYREVIAAVGADDREAPGLRVPESPREKAVSSHEVSRSTRQRQCRYRREGSRSTRQRQCRYRREGSTNTRQRQCRYRREDSTTHKANAVSSPRRQHKHTRQRQCLRREGSTNTRQGPCLRREGSTNTRQMQCLRREGSTTHKAKAVTSPRRQHKHTRQR